jgi:hypothetical protein
MTGPMGGASFIIDPSGWSSPIESWLSPKIELQPARPNATMKPAGNTKYVRFARMPRFPVKKR